MIEKIKRVTNPLTIIAIFAGLVEVMGTIGLAAIPDGNHGPFIYFLIGFPVYLVTLFFLTLNFNPRVLYSPSDFSDEKNFMQVVVATKTVQENYDKLEEKIIDIKKSIAREKLASHESRSPSLPKANQQPPLDAILNAIKATNTTNRTIISSLGSKGSMPIPRKISSELILSDIEKVILNTIRKEGHPLKTQEIVRNTGLDTSTTVQTLRKLIEKNEINVISKDGPRYQLNEK